MRFLTLSEVLELHRRVAEQSGGLMGIRNLGGLESSLAQPRMTFGGADLYPNLIEKASALGFSIIQNHPFVDGNKRTAHAAMETFLILNGSDLFSRGQRAQVLCAMPAIPRTTQKRLTRNSCLCQNWGCNLERIRLRFDASKSHPIGKIHT